MTRLLLLSLILVPGALRAEPPAPRFRPLQVVLESDRPLAAWQVEVVATEGDGTLVGVEGGEAPFDEPAYYDPAALMGGRIVLAAFSTEAALPSGRRTVAVLHVREAGPVAWTVRLQAAAASDGEPAHATAHLVPFEGGAR